MKDENKKEEETKIEKVDYTKMNIYKKMLIATDKIERVKKNLTVGEGKSSYKAVSEADVLEAVKDVEVELGIYSYPFDRKVIKDDREVFKNSYGEKENFFIRLEIIYRFVNVDNTSEFVDVKTYGDGVDSQDKAPGKAMTYGDKYALLKAYKIETGNDPDKDPSGEVVQKKATKEQIEKLNKLVDDIPAMLNYFKIEKIEDMTDKQAEATIKKRTNENPA
jgi:putative ubiquitin-RnfH superfamily antitoxin RatB of RatAB toxin-antitoxin module